KSPIWVIFGVFALTILSGGFVAGLNAGVIYNDWPDMGGGFVPSDYGGSDAWWLNGFENPAAAQFHHRILAYCSLAAAIWFCWTAHRRESDRRWEILAKLIVAIVGLQLLLGIATLLAVVPVPLGVVHQMGAITLFCLSVAGLRLAYGARSP
ncbi:MAG TPA: heme A synthase, partial [Rhodospirillaceae bacterium]|nr:heme A synthase [Rhodospirillaceae bacterium]